jgi:hypothetical protein
MAVRQMAPGVERHPHHLLVAEILAEPLPFLRGQLGHGTSTEARECRGLDPLAEHGPERHQVRVDAAVRLHVGVLGTEQPAGEVYRVALDRVDVLAPGVEAMAGGPLAVLVAQPVAHREQHRGRGEVLAGDQLELRTLVGELATQALDHFGGDASNNVEGRRVGDRLGRELGPGVAGHVFPQVAIEPRVGHGRLLPLQPDPSGFRRPGVRLDLVAPRWSIPPRNASRDAADRTKGERPESTEMLYRLALQCRRAAVGGGDGRGAPRWRYSRANAATAPRLASSGTLGSAVKRRSRSHSLGGGPDGGRAAADASGALGHDCVASVIASRSAATRSEYRV